MADIAASGLSVQERERILTALDAYLRKVATHHDAVVADFFKTFDRLLVEDADILHGLSRRA